MRYEQFEKFPISYVGALFKELRFQPEPVEVVEAAIQNSVAKGVRIELDYGLAGVGCRLFVMFRTLLVDQRSPGKPQYVGATHESPEPGRGH
jgi:DNA-directed RNA polymerase subunit E'/Rpb7